MLTEIKKVEVGDKFIDTCHRKSKRVSTVIDLTETRSIITGELISTGIVAEHEFMGQMVKTYPCTVTVQRNRV